MALSRALNCFDFKSVKRELRTLALTSSMMEIDILSGKVFESNYLPFKFGDKLSSEFETFFSYSSSAHIENVPEKIVVPIVSCMKIGLEGVLNIDLKFEI